MSKPRWIDIQAPNVELKALTWGPSDGPIALCLHGFPDTAYGWRNLAPRLAESGWRVVAPFMRGYAPSSIPADGSYHIGALMHDALQVRAAARGAHPHVGVRPRLGCDGRQRPGCDPGQPIRQSGDHVGATGCGVSETGSRYRPVAGADPASAAAQLVHHVLPIALAARAFGVLGVAAAVEAMVAGLRRQGGPASRRRRDRHTGELARRTRAVPGHDPQHPSADAVPRPAPALDVAAEVAELVPSRARRRLHDIGFHPLDTRRPSRRQRRERRRRCRTLPTA